MITSGLPALRNEPLLTMISGSTDGKRDSFLVVLFQVLIGFGGNVNQQFTRRFVAGLRYQFATKGLAISAAWFFDSGAGGAVTGFEAICVGKQ